MWQPISPRYLVTKITNDRVHFILLACHALPLDSHWLFQCELASCVAVKFGHANLHIYFGTFWAHYQSPDHTSTFEHGSEGLTHSGEVPLSLQLKKKSLFPLSDNWTPFILCRFFCTGFYIEDSFFFNPVFILDFDTQHERLINKVRELWDYMDGRRNTQASEENIR